MSDLKVEIYNRGSNGENSYVFSNASSNRSGKSGRGGDSYSGRGGEGYDWPIGYGDGAIPGNPGGPGAGGGGAVAHNTNSDAGGGDGGEGYLTVEQYARLLGP